MQTGKEDSGQIYFAQLYDLGKEVQSVVSLVEDIENNLSTSYSTESLLNLSRRFEDINNKFTNYITITDSRFYEIIHRSRSRLTAARNIAREAKIVAQLFEKYSKSPKSYSAVNSRLQINKLKGELNNLQTHRITTKRVEIVVDGDIKEFTVPRLQALVFVLSNLLQISEEYIQILGVSQTSPGNVALMLEIPDDAIKELSFLIMNNDNRLKQLSPNILSLTAEGEKTIQQTSRDETIDPRKKIQSKAPSKTELMQSIAENTLGELDKQTLGDLDAGSEISAPNVVPNEAVKESAKTPNQQIPANVNGIALSDAYSKDDLLGYSDYVNALANFIESPKTKKPITIGIDAAWGGGKTTLMRLLEKRLNPKELKIATRSDQTSKRWPWQKERKLVTSKVESIYTVWFNAWQYDQQETLWAALVLEILSQVQKQSTRKQRIQSFFSLNYNRFKWGSLGWDIVKFIVIVLALLGAGYFAFSLLANYLGKTWMDAFEWLKDWVKVFATIGFASLAYTIFKDMAGLIISPFSLGISRYMKEPDYKNKIGFVRQFQEDFRCVIESVTQKGKWPLVVFIDDLDRCSAPKAAEVIEAINLLLDSEHCVFIIGMDSMMLSRSIQAKYKDIQPFFENLNYSSSVGLGRHFLEKIIQIDFRIPQPDKPHIADFINIQLGRNRVPKEQPVEQQVVESLIQAEQRAGKTENEAKQVIQTTHPSIDPAVLVAAVESVQERTFEELPEVVRIVNELAYYLNYNPRRIKRFINMYRLQALIAYQRDILETTISLDNLACWVAISMRWPEFINSAMRDTRIISQIRVDILSLEKAKDLIASVERIRKSRKYSPDILPLLTDAEFAKLLNKITGKAGDAENYFHLSQLSLTE